MSDIREVPANELFGALLDCAPSRVFPFTRTLETGERVTTKIRVKLLRVDETIAALAKAQEYAKKVGELEGYGDIYREAQAHELLWRALVHVEQITRNDGTRFYPPLCVSSEHLRTRFNEHELAVLLNCYQIVKAEFGILEELNEVSAETWIARFSDPLKGPFYLSQLDSRHWPAVIRLLAQVAADLCRSAGYQLPSLDGSSASPPESSTADTTSPDAQQSGSVSLTDGGDPLPIEPGKLLTAEDAKRILQQGKKPSG